MQFKRIKGKPYGVSFNTKEQQVIDEEIANQLVEKFRAMETDISADVLWMLHKDFGFGPVRLRKAFNLMTKSLRDLCDHYELPQEDGNWLCTYKLKEIGCDVAQWYADELKGN